LASERDLRQALKLQNRPQPFFRQRSSASALQGSRARDPIVVKWQGQHACDHAPDKQSAYRRKNASESVTPLMTQQHRSDGFDRILLEENECVLAEK